MNIDLTQLTPTNLAAQAIFAGDQSLGGNTVFLMALPQPIVCQKHVCRSLFVTDAGKLYLCPAAEDTLFKELQRHTNHYYFSEAQASMISIRQEVPFCYLQQIYIRFNRPKYRCWLALHQVDSWQAVTRHKIVCTLLTGHHLSLNLPASKFNTQCENAILMAQYRHHLFTEMLGYQPETFVKQRCTDSYVWRQAYRRQCPPFPSLTETITGCLKFIINRGLKTLPVLKSDPELCDKTYAECCARLIEAYQRA